MDMRNVNLLNGHKESRSTSQNIREVATICGALPEIKKKSSILIKALCMRGYEADPENLEYYCRYGSHL